ncbi:hypothetical protein TUM4644_26740 [Shewanella colwelliana]|uniref:Uncharacterized protein n=1 Tax=Shewanella colwelliana TaxID=23 RepID=A0ABQ4P5X7_SHECO|nr:hypothetical protein TUM4644_26740 [Shewanella colwelliana]GIU42934.1 hypothetical protein TUM3794_27380 [Shewanella colwelliana]
MSGALIKNLACRKSIRESVTTHSKICLFFSFNIEELLTFAQFRVKYYSDHINHILSRLQVTLVSSGQKI